MSFEGSVQGMFQGSAGAAGTGRAGGLWPLSLSLMERTGLSSLQHPNPGN